METKNVIYLYTNKINNHMYIGQAVDFKNRHYDHKSGKGVVNNSRIDAAFLKYGEDAFDIKILASAPNMDNDEARDYLDALEEYYIWKYNTLKDENHYNLQAGGHNFGIGENNIFWKDEARVIKGGLTGTGKQSWGLRFKGKTLRRSINKEELLKICDEINNRNMDIHSKDERAYVIKAGMAPHGKQNYAIKYKGRILKNSVFKNKLQDICDEINLEKKFNIPKNQLSIINEAHVIKCGVATGEQRYGIKFEGKTIKTSSNEEELQELCNIINTKGIDEFCKLEAEKSKKDKAIIVKSGINRQGKQTYAVNYNGKSIKNSINKEKLEEICDEINSIGIDNYLEKNNTKDKAVIRGRKGRYYISYNGKTIKNSVNREKLEKICDEINSLGIDKYIEKENRLKNEAIIVKGGIVSSGKQNYSIKHKGKIIKSSVDKEKLEKICEGINKRVNY